MGTQKSYVVSLLGDRTPKQKVKLNVFFGAKKYVYPWIKTQIGWSNGKTSLKSFNITWHII
ncbi:hypothetical protein YC2023_017324 [Brassica napus]